MPRLWDLLTEQEKKYLTQRFKYTLPDNSLDEVEAIEEVAKIMTERPKGTQAVVGKIPVSRNR